MTQCLVDYFEDGDGYFWHHRCLLISDGSGRWVGCTPDFEYMIIDLSEHRVVLLERKQIVPDRYHGQLYMFNRNDVGDAVLEEMHRRARSLASLLGFRQAAGTSPGRWVVSDTAHQAFREEVPAEICGVDTEFIAKGTTSLVRIDSIWTTAELVSEDVKKLEE